MQDREAISALQAIKQKEVAWRHRLEAAREQAKIALQAAQQEAAQLVAQADQQGRQEAEACFQRGVEQTQQEAQAILTAAQREADIMSRRATAQLAEVVTEVVRLVLPHGTS